MKTEMFKIGAFAVIFDKNKRVLLVKRRDYPFWNLPGGGVEKGENPDEAVIREVKEETGLAVRIKDLIGVYFKSGRNEIVFTYICKKTRGRLTKSSESAQLKYFVLNKMPKRLPKSHKERIKDAFNFRGKVFRRVQKAGSTKELFQI